MTESERPRVRVSFPAERPVGPAATDVPTTVPGVALVTLDRPEAHNALDYRLLDELATALERLDADAECRCIVLTGAGERAFAAGADVRELAAETSVSLYGGSNFARWERIRGVRTPIVAAVRGWALGGGNELAMTCDMVVAGEDARFGQPEIRLGVIPGAGGTQRLTRAVGKARAMELVLTGRAMDAREAYAAGLVTKVVPAEETVDAALDLASLVAEQPPLAVRAAKEAVERAFELPLGAGLEYERRLFYLLFASQDQREGMAAFSEKRTPHWTGS
ncbi:MAG TPA: enoyl-CoA hydratase-related protein [Candidatus Limnocylindrales bacterium]